MRSPDLHEAHLFAAALPHFRLLPQHKKHPSFRWLLYKFHVLHNFYLIFFFLSIIQNENQHFLCERSADFLLSLCKFIFLLPLLPQFLFPVYRMVPAHILQTGTHKYLFHLSWNEERYNIQIILSSEYLLR